MMKLIKVCSVIVALILLLLGGTSPEPAKAQWPPFIFRLTPSLEEGRITYQITRLESEVDWLINDVQIKIPLPEGLRFIEAGTPSVGQASFDGKEVSFFFLDLNQKVKDAYFVVEVADPSQTTFTLQPWLSWQGQISGSYLAEAVVVDTSRPLQLLEWQKPAALPIQLEAKASVANQIITYQIYPQRVNRERIWDLKISLPLPEGTTFLSAAAPPSFETNFDGHEVSFFILEAPPKLESLQVKLSAEGVLTPTLTTQAWASWKNVSRWSVATIGAESRTGTGDIVVQPQSTYYTVADQAGDVPFGDYDLTSVSFQNSASMLGVTFFTAGQLCGSSQPLEFRLFIDADCRADTGESRENLGADYDIRYDLARDEVRVGAWNATSSSWPRVEAAVNRFLGQQAVTIQVPYSVVGNSRQFCWAARGRNENELFVPALPDDWLPESNNAELTQLQPVTPTQASLAVPPATELAATSPLAACNLEQALSSPTPTPAFPAPAGTAPSSGSNSTGSESNVTTPFSGSGKIAVPLYSSLEGYNIHIFSLPEGQEIARIAAARQPNFWADGQRLLFKRSGENGGLYEYNFTDGTEKLVSDRLNHQHPFYDPWGRRLVYGNFDLIMGGNNTPQPSLMVQCNLNPPSQEAEPGCQNIIQSGTLVSAGSTAEIPGSHPVWTLTDKIAYKGCSSGQCGIYAVPSNSTRGLSDGLAPGLITTHPSDTPSDTKGSRIAFSSQRDGNWEAYIVNLDGTGLRNRSTGSLSQDGLPVISPDGKWVAFVSNRGGAWAIWATPAEGGETRKLFDLPSDRRVGIDDQDWLNERLAWGP